jgi:hypothetical protein
MRQINKVPNGGPVTNHTPVQQPDKHNDTNSRTIKQRCVFRTSVCMSGMEGVRVVGS